MSTDPPPSSPPPSSTTVSPPMWYYYGPFHAFQDTLTTLTSDVKDVLHQLQTIRATQTKTNTRLTTLEDVLGVATRTRRGRRELGAPETSVVQQLAAIQSAIDLLRCASQSSMFPSGADPSHQTSPSLPSVAIPTSPQKRYTETSIQAGLPSPATEPSHSPRLSHIPDFPWGSVTHGVAAHGLSVGHSTQQVALTAEYLDDLVRDAHSAAAGTTATDGQTSQCDGDDPTACLSTPFIQLPMSSLTLPHASGSVADNSKTHPTVSPNSLDTNTSVAPSPGQIGVMETSTSLTRVTTESSHQTHSRGTADTDRSHHVPFSGTSFTQPPISTHLHARKSAVDNLRTHPSTSRASDMASSFLVVDDSVAPLPECTGMTETPPSLVRAQVRTSLQVHSRGAEGTDPSMASPEMSLPGNSPTSPNSTGLSKVGHSKQPHPGLNSKEVQMISSTGRDDGLITNRAKERVSSPGQSRLGSNLEDAQITSHTDCDSVVPNGVDMVPDPELTSVAQRHRSQLPGPASGLPTPPSESSLSDFGLRLVGPLPRDPTAATDLHACPLLKLPVQPTPQMWTPGPLGGEDRDAHRDVQDDSTGLPSPLAPPMLKPSTTHEMPPPEEGVRDVSREVTVQDVTEEVRGSLDDVGNNAAEEVDATSRADDPICAVPIVTPTDEPLPGVEVSGDIEPSATSSSSPGQHRIELSHVAIHFSSLANPTSGPISRYATPSESTSAVPDEDEVWNTLMLGASGLSTPVPDEAQLPLTTSHQSSHAPPVRSDTMRHSGSTSANDVAHDPVPELRAVDPLMFHDLPFQCPNLSSSPLTPEHPLSEESLSSLTSIADSNDLGHVSPPCSPVARARAPSEATLVDVRAASRPLLGGPSATLDELTVLARRAPPKIFLKLPGLKRKRDEGGVEGCKEAPALSTPLPSVSLEGITSNPLTETLPRKRTKKHSEDGEQDVCVATPRNKSHRARRVKPRPLVTHHVRNGRIKTVNAIAAAESQGVIPSVPQEAEPGEGAGQGSRGRKRHRQSNQTKATSSRRVKSSSKKDGVIVWELMLQNSGTWPALPDPFEQWHLQLIQCDSCDKWYHYGCVGVERDDPRLGTEACFGCPPCHTQSARRRTTRRREDVCQRPDCPEPGITGETEVFYVEKLVGRKKIDATTYMWLAKWEGYPMSEATWIPKENVVGDGARLFNTFSEDAVEEGADLSHDVLLLQEALDAGLDG